MASTVQQHIALAKTLPPRLLTFFTKYPPSIYSHKLAPLSAASGPKNVKAILAEQTASEDSNAPVETPKQAAEPEAIQFQNPFQPKKNFVTGKWRGPVYGLRIQADLVKLAQEHGVVDLLPYTIKLPGEKAQKRAEQGLRVKGTGVGQKVKGKMWERTLKGKLEERRQAMLKMPQMIQEWKQRGHGRGWKKWPK